MNHCSVPQCDINLKESCSRGSVKRSVFRLPVDSEVRKSWLTYLDACGKELHENVMYRICEFHFESKDILTNKARKILRANVIPTIPMPNQKDPQKTIKMTSCSVPACKVESSLLQMYTMPKNPKIQRKWMEFLLSCGKTIEQNVQYVICEFHFDPADIVYGREFKSLKPNSVPIEKCMNTDEAEKLANELKAQWDKEEALKQVKLDHEYSSVGVFKERDELRRKVLLLEVLLSYEQDKNAKRVPQKKVAQYLPNASTKSDEERKIEELEQFLIHEQEKNEKLRTKLNLHLTFCSATADSDLEACAAPPLPEVSCEHKNIADLNGVIYREAKRNNQPKKATGLELQENQQATNSQDIPMTTENMTPIEMEVDDSDAALIDIFIKEEPQFQCVIKNYPTVP